MRTLLTRCLLVGKICESIFEPEAVALQGVTVLALCRSPQPLLRVILGSTCPLLLAAQRSSTTTSLIDRSVIKASLISFILQT